MIVMKFGGTSIADPASIKRVIEIIRGRIEKEPVVVNSAMGKTTRNLLESTRLAAKGQEDEALKRLEQIRMMHDQLAVELVPEYNKSPLAGLLDTYFRELAKLLGGMSVLHDSTPRSLDHFLAYGERIATAIMASALDASGIPSELLDARRFIITDDRFGQAAPLRDETENKIREIVLPVRQSGRVPIIQGYIGSSRDGSTTTLGFEGSDLTAVLVGAALQTDDIQIWKDVSGIMTADPELFPQARTVKSLTFEEAAALTFFGAKVLHPNAVRPAQKQGIPVHIFNSKKPDIQGTEITARMVPCKNAVKSIAYKKPISILRVQSNRSQPTADFFRSVFDAMDRERIAPYVFTAAESSVSMAVSPGLTDGFLDELGQTAEVSVRDGMALITLVGETIKSVQDIHTFFRHLEGIKIDLIAQGPSPIAVSFAVSENDLHETINRLHRYFFSELDPAIFE